MPPEWQQIGRMIVAIGFVALLIWSIATGQMEE